MLIIGVAGTNGSGKTEVVRFLTERSFVSCSLSDVLRRELEASGAPETREAMIELGTEQRRLHGPSVLARKVLEMAKPDRNYVVDSIRHPAEVAAFRESGRTFLLLWIDAPDEVRLRRLVARGRPGDPCDIDKLREFDSRESGSGDSCAQQLRAVRGLADEVLVNDGSLEALNEATRAVLSKFLYFERPGWDEYFMSVARVVSSRSNCVKRKVAAVATIDRRIVSTGYNGTPRGIRNCNEGGCPRCNSFGREGADLSECLCSHGEENAITQAAYHGVSLRGSTLFTTYCPCLLCTKMIINAGIAEVVYSGGYPRGDVSLLLLQEAGVRVRRMDA